MRGDKRHAGSHKNPFNSLGAFGAAAGALFEIFIKCLLRSQGYCLLMQNLTFAGLAGSIIFIRVLTHSVHKSIKLGNVFLMCFWEIADQWLGQHQPPLAYSCQAFIIQRWRGCCQSRQPGSCQITWLCFADVIFCRSSLSWRRTGWHFSLNYLRSLGVLSVYSLPSQLLIIIIFFLWPVMESA